MREEGEMVHGGPTVPEAVPRTSVSGPEREVVRVERQLKSPGPWPGSSLRSS